MDNLKVYDLKDITHRSWIQPFEQLIYKIEKSYANDKLIKNYTNLHLEWQNFEAFNVITRSSEVLGFSGMHNSPYPDGVSRVLSKLFYTELLRKKSLKSHSFPSFASRLMLPFQVEKAKSLGKLCIFLSFENLGRRRFCHKLAQNLSEEFDQPWFVHKDMVNTARKLPDGTLNYDKSVWQNIVCLKLDSHFEINLPTMSIEEWQLRYGR